MFRFDIESFSFFRSKEDETNFILNNISKVKVRRLNWVSKVAIDLSFEVVGDSEVDYIAYSSRHGELCFSYEIISSFLERDRVSPAKFSQSVHNSNPSYLTVLKKLNIPVTAVSSGRDSFLYGLMASLNYIKQHRSSTVLFLYSDCSVPKIYREKLVAPNENIVSAILLKDGDRFHLRPAKEGREDDVDSLQAFVFYKWYNSNDSINRSLNIGERSKWCVEQFGE